jgi:hypothetical protein
MYMCIIPYKYVMLLLLLRQDNITPVVFVAATTTLVRSHEGIQLLCAIINVIITDIV